MLEQRHFMNNDIEILVVSCKYEPLNKRNVKQNKMIHQKNTKAN